MQPYQVELDFLKKSTDFIFNHAVQLTQEFLSNKKHLVFQILDTPVRL